MRPAVTTGVEWPAASNVRLMSAPKQTLTFSGIHFGGMGTVAAVVPGVRVEDLTWDHKRILELPPADTLT